MNISITFRHMESSSAVKAYAGEKVSKLQKFLRLPMTAKVTLSIDKLRHVAEARISSGGQHLEAREDSEDMYASIDMIVDKLERQIRGTKGVKQAKARRVGRVSEPAVPEKRAPKPAPAPKVVAPSAADLRALKARARKPPAPPRTARKRLTVARPLKKG
ncbi:MAG: ribosome-associated translation inhibitor RaiA [Polyangiaceae bacterium]|nr:ribosome-associated translation inhibitor RaiA [Polyangiaceae bacterium]